jgi:hypothetical protein
MRTSPRFFAVLGVAPAIGRTPTPDEERFAGPPVAIVSDTFWRDRLNSDPSAAGRRLILGGVQSAFSGRPHDSSRRIHRHRTRRAGEDLCDGPSSQRRVLPHAAHSDSRRRHLQRRSGDAAVLEGARDAVTFLAVPVVLAAVAAVTAYVPARRAARLDPVHALRVD